MVDIASFKALFSRGQFDYGETLPQVRDADITNALSEANAVFNPDIYPADKPEIGDLALSYLTAHFLRTDLDAADAEGQSRFIQTSRSVDGVSESVEIPEWMKQGEFAFYATTYFGQKWLMITKPYLDGAVYVVGGTTLP